MDELGKANEESLGNKLIKGSAWMLAMRWFSRFMGLASMAVVARLLAPADFGIYAVATALIGLLDAFTDIGADIAIIRHPDPQRCHYDTAWTLKIILHGLSALLIVLAAPLAAHVYADDRYEAVLQVLALSMLVQGFSNIGVANFRRQFEFYKDFQFQILVQVVGVLSTFGLAFLFRSYWALVLGGLVRSIAAVVLSYLLQDYRPRLSLSARREMFGFSFWIMVRSVASFLIGSADRLVLGAFFSSTITGWYAIASTLATMAVFELLLPIGRALLPGMAAKQGDTEWERRNLNKIFSGTATIAAVAGLGLSALATPAVTLVYGERFAGAGPMLAILAIAAAVGGFNQPAGHYLLVSGKARELAILFFLEGIVTMSATYVLAANGVDIEGVVYARLAVAGLALVRLFYMLRATSILGWQDIVIAWLRPIMAGLAMYAALWVMQGSLSLSPVYTLALGIPLGGLVYIGTLLFVWRLMGRPPGIEDEILQRIFGCGPQLDKNRVY